MEKIKEIKEILIEDYDYDLPESRIAQIPVRERDRSQLLISENGKIHKDIFNNIDKYIPDNSLLVFNNTRVIRARLLFRKETGAEVEILCLEPVNPSDYQLSFGSRTRVDWKCMVGNLKKWKNGPISLEFTSNGKKKLLTATKLFQENETCIVRFSWDDLNLSFGEVIEATGHIPLPPYINREDIEEDSVRYQTVYSRIKGSVAAPTAGLHFTPGVFENLKERGINKAEITLHVGAGTFQPVKSDRIIDHNMHSEHFSVDIETIRTIQKYQSSIIPVGTTSVRTLESLYWLGVKLLLDPKAFIKTVSLGQWESYELPQSFTTENALKALEKYMLDINITVFNASTSIIIVPGYKFRMTKGLITNFHQPRSTLLLLISAFTGEKWKDIYDYALKNNFRFLSYGDSSILLDKCE